MPSLQLLPWAVFCSQARHWKYQALSLIMEEACRTKDAVQDRSGLPLVCAQLEVLADSGSSTGKGGCGPGLWGLESALHRGQML